MITLGAISTELNDLLDVVDAERYNQFPGQFPTLGMHGSIVRNSLVQRLGFKVQSILAREVKLAEAEYDRGFTYGRKVGYKEGHSAGYDEGQQTPSGPVVNRQDLRQAIEKVVTEYGGIGDPRRLGAQDMRTVDLLMQLLPQGLVVGSSSSPTNQPSAGVCQASEPVNLAAGSAAESPIPGLPAFVRYEGPEPTIADLQAQIEELDATLLTVVQRLDRLGVAQSERFLALQRRFEEHSNRGQVEVRTLQANIDNHKHTVPWHAHHNSTQEIVQ